MMELMTIDIVVSELVHDLGSVLDHLPVEMHTEREIPSPDDRSSRVCEKILHLSELTIPSCRSHDDVEVMFSIELHILKSN